MAAKRALAKKTRGYPKLAGQIGFRPELAIFRRFGALNAENLLYLQAELVLLEKALDKQQQRDSQSNHPRKVQYALDWYQLKYSAEHGDTVQLDLVRQIRKVLKQYNDALIQQSKILAFSKPHKQDLNVLQHFLYTDLDHSLCGPDSTTWGSVLHRKDYSADLIATCPRPAEDPFSNWAVDRTITYLFRLGCARFMKASPLHGVIGYEEATIFRVTYWMTSIIASLIPIASIAVLYMVHSMRARLATIAGLNVLISICLCGLTKATRSEIFAVASAFAAVQVVFVSADKN